MEVPVYNLAGEVVENITISDDVFAVPFNEAVVHQAMVRQRANARQGTVDTKRRAEVSGGGAKLFRQKHTSFARAGTRRSPLRRGGGVVFGPHPRDYSQAMPKKMRRLAIKCLLSAKAADEELKVLKELKLAEPKSREMARILGALGTSSSALIITGEVEENVVKSARNLPGIKILPARLLNVLDLLSYQILLMTVEAVRVVEGLWGKKLAEGESSASLPGIAASTGN